MITALLVAGAGLVVLVATVKWIRPSSPISPRDQVDAFTRARAVTTRWSADPGTTPAPLKAYLAEQKRRATSED